MTWHDMTCKIDDNSWLLGVDMISALAVQQYFKLEMIYYTWLSI